MKTKLTLAIKLLLAVALILSAREYMKAYRAECMNFAYQSAKFGHIRASHGETWQKTEAEFREYVRQMNDVK